MAKDGEDPLKFATPLPLPDLPDAKVGMAAPSVVEPMPLPAVPPLPSQDVGGMVGPDGEKAGFPGPSDGEGDRVLLALNGIQSSLDRIEQVLREAMT